MRLIDHQAKHFGVFFGFFRLAGKAFRDAITYFDGPLVQRLHAAWEEVGTVKNQFFNPFRVFQGKGCFRANSKAMLPPSEKPKMLALAMLFASIKSYKSSANWVIVKGFLPLGDFP